MRRRSPTSYHALDAGHEIVPVLNKIDLRGGGTGQVKRQIEDVIGIDASDAVMISAKTGLGIDEVLEAIVHRLPAPKGDHDASLKALLVDSWYDVYLASWCWSDRRRVMKRPAHPDDGHQCRLRRRARRLLHAEDDADR